MANPRNIALQVLLKIENDKAYSNIALNNAVRESGIGGVDSAFVSALVYGVLERQITLDYIIKQHSKIPLRKIETKTKLILRMGIYQLVYMDRVPDSAAVNESVNLAKKHRLNKSAGFINGVLRSVTRAEPRLALPQTDDKIYCLSVKYSAPQELVRLWQKSYGEENAEKLLEALSGRPRIFARVNTLKTTAEELAVKLGEQGVECEISNVLENALVLSRTGSIEKLGCYREGLFHIQDLSSQLCVCFLDPKPREVVLDVCSAPGGKAATAAQYMNNRGRIFACDLYDHKLRLIKANARRLGIDIISEVRRDAAAADVNLPRAGKILCDVPCSGLGILSRKPEIRCKSDLIDNDLPALQYKILCQSAKNLEVGGRLVYSTCTLNPAENNENAARFLREHPCFRGVPLKLPEGISRAVDEKEYEITLMPHTAGCDGFYTAVFERTAADD
ncbi:MAG: 16S rRNA (cytosine(967)-C(5))-methyltransferase RsmB [Ruminococcus sp.]|nr:16S rRNA (cytosine(967)-C(5))-methyltransferase RsmB [Ruminococcus sp.]